MMTDLIEFWKCIICLKKYPRYEERHSPQPLFQNGICCTECNFNLVIPYRMHLLSKRRDE